MSPRPDWVNSSALESLLLLELLDTSSPPAPGVELCRASQLRGDERESRLRKLPLFIENFPSLLYKSNISGLGAANYNYCEQYFFVQTVIFSTSSARWRCRQRFVVWYIVHCSCDSSAELCRVMFAWKVAVTTGLGPEPRPLHWFSVTRPQHSLDRDKAGQTKYGIYRLGRGSWLKLWSQSNFDQMFDLRLRVVEPSLG